MKEIKIGDKVVCRKLLRIPANIAFLINPTVEISGVVEKIDNNILGVQTDAMYCLVNRQHVISLNGVLSQGAQ